MDRLAVGETRFSRTGPFLASATVTCEDSHVDRTGKLLLGFSAVAIALSLAGCAVPADQAAPGHTAEATSAATTSARTSPSASDAPPATPAPTHPVDPRDTAYDAEVAAWADEIPAGFAWPSSITGLPAGSLHGKGDWSRYTTAVGIYHCMFVYAAWDAYFVDNDASASKEYAARADATIPEQPYPTWVTSDDGSILDQALASESGICNGFVGDLRT